MTRGRVRNDISAGVKTEEDIFLICMYAVLSRTIHSYYLDQRMHNILTVMSYFVKYSDMFRCIYIIFRESFLI